MPQVKWRCERFASWERCECEWLRNGPNPVDGVTNVRWSFYWRCKLSTLAHVLTPRRGCIAHETTILEMVGMTIAIVASSATGASANEGLPERRAPDRWFRVTAPVQCVDDRTVVKRLVMPQWVPMLCFDAEENGTQESSCALPPVAATSKKQGSGTVLDTNAAPIWPRIPDCGRPGKKRASTRRHGCGRYERPVAWRSSQPDQSSRSSESQDLAPQVRRCGLK